MSLDESPATQLTLHGRRHPYMTNPLAAGMNRATVGKLAGARQHGVHREAYFKLLGDHDAAAARVCA
jgi:hypothetical protein